MTTEYAMLILLKESVGTAPRDRWYLDKPQMLIGRAPTADIHLPNRQVSRQHALIRHTEAGFVIEDLGSKNRTFVNGEAIEAPRLLRDGDIVQIGLAYRFSFVDREGTIPVHIEMTDERRLRIDPERREVWVAGRLVEPPLSPQQFQLLYTLYQAQGRTLSRDEIIAAVWGEEASQGVTEQALDALIRRLRRRLAEYAPHHEFIVTVRGHGFRYDGD